jgi:hypothetical protein
MFPAEAEIRRSLEAEKFIQEMLGKESERECDE